MDETKTREPGETTNKVDGHDPFAIVRVSQWFFRDLLRLPEDFRVVGAFMDGMRNELVIQVESSLLPAVAMSPNQDLPALWPEYLRHDDGTVTLSKLSMRHHGEDFTISFEE